MLTHSPKIVSVSEGIQKYGGYIRYYDSTENLKDILSLTTNKTYNNILACCGGGNQALTLAALLKKGGALFAIDINPAQLFLLSAKTIFLSKQKTPPFYPDLKKIQHLYPGKVSPAPQDLRYIKEVFDFRSHSYKKFPEKFQKNLAFLCDSGYFSNNKYIPFWNNDTTFISYIKRNAKNIRLIHDDILFVNEWLPKESIDLIYLSDISLFSPFAFHMERIKSLLSTLAPHGTLIGHIDRGENFKGKGIPLIKTIANQADKLNLSVSAQKKSFLIIKKAT